MEEKIAKLKEASRMLEEAADLIDEAMHMTDVKRRSDIVTERIRRISSSNDDDSISNLIKELEYASEEHPGWTRPFASVKNVNRKDI